MEAIFGIEKVVVVDVDGSPTGRKVRTISRNLARKLISSATGTPHLEPALCRRPRRQARPHFDLYGGVANLPLLAGSWRSRYRLLPGTFPRVPDHELALSAMLQVRNQCEILMKQVRSDRKSVV